MGHSDIIMYTCLNKKHVKRSLFLSVKKKLRLKVNFILCISCEVVLSKILGHLKHAHVLFRIARHLFVDIFP